MRGHVTQRGTSWYYWVETGRDAAGKRKQLSRGGFATKREAERALSAVVSTIDAGSYVGPTKETITSFFRDWLPSAKSRMRSSTWATYETLAEKHIVPALGGVRLSRLTTAQINRFYADLLDHGRRDGKGGLSARTVGHIHGVLRLALGDAVKWQLLARNPAEQASPPRKQRKELQVWSAAEARTFLESVRDDRLYVAYALALTTGLRRGELLGLAWRDVDLEAGLLQVRQTVISVNFKVIVSTPKTAAGRRAVAIDPATVELLREHRLRQLRERHLLGLGAQSPDDLVFAAPDGAPLNPALFTDAFDRRVRAAGVARITFHGVRHTAATLMLTAGVHPKVVQERLGHASVSITLDLYSHSVPSLQVEAASKMGALIFAPRERPGCRSR